MDRAKAIASKRLEEQVIFLLFIRHFRFKQFFRFLQKMVEATLIPMFESKVQKFIELKNQLDQMNAEHEQDMATKMQRDAMKRDLEMRVNEMMEWVEEDEDDFEDKSLLEDDESFL
jgi:threonine aldolase